MLLPWDGVPLLAVVRTAELPVDTVFSDATASGMPFRQGALAIGDACLPQHLTALQAASTLVRFALTFGKRHASRFVADQGTIILCAGDFHTLNLPPNKP